MAAAKKIQCYFHNLWKKPVGREHIAPLHSIAPLNRFLLLFQYTHSNGSLLIKMVWYRIYKNLHQRERNHCSTEWSKQDECVLFLLLKLFIIPFSKSCMSFSVLNTLHFPSISFPGSENLLLCIFQSEKAVLFSHIDLYSNTFNLRDD